MRAVRNTPDERSSHANIMELTDHREMLRFISTVELPYRHNKLLNITVDEEQERRHDQIFDGRIHSPEHGSQKYWNAYC